MVNNSANQQMSYCYMSSQEITRLAHLEFLFITSEEVYGYSLLCVLGSRRGLHENVIRNGRTWMAIISWQFRLECTVDPAGYFSHGPYMAYDNT